MLDLANAEKFDPDVRSVEKTTEGPIGVGTEFRFHERTPPFGRFQQGFLKLFTPWWCATAGRPGIRDWRTSRPGSSGVVVSFCRYGNPRPAVYRENPGL